MIKKLQRRFIIITMVAVVAVLGIIMVSVNAVNYYNVAKYADTVLDALADNGGQFAPKDEIGGSIKPNGGGMTNETPFETRYFTVIFGADGQVDKVDTGKIAAIGAEQAIKYASDITSKNKERGYKGVYRYLKVESPNGGTMVIFTDCSRQLTAADDFLRASAVISVIGVAGVLVLVLLLSKKAIAPIAKSYVKQKRFITDASHELKTPLSIISANNDITEMESGETDTTRSIAKQVVRMTTMVKNLTLLAKIDENDALQNKQTFSLTDAVIDVVKPFCKAVSIGSKVINLNVDDGITVNGDEELIRKVIGILMDNAAKYSISYINVSLTVAKSRKVLTVSNDALKLEQGSLDKCFDRFYRSDEMRASGIEGSGIGLSIAKEIVELHKGKAEAFSPDGKEFSVKIILP